MPLSRRIHLKTLAAALYLKCSLFSWWEVYTSQAKLSSYVNMVQSTAETCERLRLPGVSRRLSYVAQWRDDRFSFRCNPEFADFLQKHRMARRLANATLLT